MMRFGIAKPKNNMYTAYDVLFGSSHAGAQLNINILLYRIYQKYYHNVYSFYLGNVISYQMI